MTTHRPSPAWLAAALVLTMLASACAAGGGAAGPTSVLPTTVGPTSTPPPDGAQSPGASQSIGSSPTGTNQTAAPGPTDAPVATGAPTDAPRLPADPWRVAELRDVRTGEVLVLNQLYGKLIVIEPMAIWCTNCRAQQNEAREALSRLASADIVYISLDVDPNESEPDLARYADERQYPWHFVVASRDVARSLAQSFGDQVLSPPSTPEIIIRPDGTAEVSFGLTRAAELEARLAALLP